MGKTEAANLEDVAARLWEPPLRADATRVVGRWAPNTAGGGEPYTVGDLVAHVVERMHLGVTPEATDPVGLWNVALAHIGYLRGEGLLVELEEEGR